MVIGKKVDDGSEKIVKYLDSLDAQLTNKNLYKFWVFPDRSGFKKTTGLNYEEMKSIIKKDFLKYKNRQIVSFAVYTTHHDNKKSIGRSVGIWLTVRIIVFNIDSLGNMFGKKNPSYSGKISWKTDDFKISKLTFQLLERLMHAIVERKIICADLMGFPLSFVVNMMHKLKLDIDDVLTPLAGLE